MSNGTPIDEFLAPAAQAFGGFLAGWSDAVVARAEAEGSPDAGEVLRGMGEVARSLADSVWEGLKQTLGGTVDATQFAAAWAAAKVQVIIEKLNTILDRLLRAAAALQAKVIGDLLGLVETLKKAIHLVLDKTIRQIDPRLAAPITLPLDLLNNLLGNMAEILSPEAGVQARRFREDMYGQLHDIRRAEGAFRPVVMLDEPVEKA